MKSDIYRTDKKLLADDVDMFRRLRLSSLFRWLQEAAIEHTERLGAGRAKTLDKGVLWVLAGLRAEISRMPEYDEQVTLTSYPGKTMHVLFPRYFGLYSADGKELVKAASVWLLLDAENRRMAFPERYGVEIDGLDCDNGMELPTGLKPFKPEKTRTMAVSFSQVDLNGHVNNAEYADIMEDALGAEFLSTHTLKSVAVDFKREMRLDARVKLGLSVSRGSVKLSGNVDGECCFRIDAEFNGKNWP